MFYNEGGETTGTGYLSTSSQSDVDLMGMFSNV